MQRPTARYTQCVPWILLMVFALSACSGKKNRQRPDPVEVVDPGPTAQELFLKGNESLDDSKWDAAIASYDEALGKDIKQWEIHMNRGIALSRLAKFPEALSAFEASLRNGGESEPLVYFNLGNLYQDRGMYSAAIDAYRASLAYGDPQNVDTLLNMGAAYIFLRQWDHAVATFEYARQSAPDDARMVHGMALVKQLQDQPRDAAELYDQVHAMDPSFALAWFNQARCYAMMKDHDAALRAITEYIRLEPDSNVIGRARGMQKSYREKLSGK